jgi:hypothetical protein
MNVKVKYMVAKSCRLCGSDQIKTILSLANMPPGDLYRTSKEESLFEAIPSEIQFCPKCTHIQMSASVDPDLLYGNYLSRPASTNQALSDIYKEYSRETHLMRKYKLPIEIIIVLLTTLKIIFINKRFCTICQRISR